MPPKPDLVFHTAPIAVETDHSAFTVQLSTCKPAQDLSHTNRPSAPIIKDWVSDSEDESETTALQNVPRTFMPPKPNLVFNIAPNDVETDHPTFTVKLSPTKPDQDLSHTLRPLAPIIEDWVFDSEDESKTKTSQIVPSFVQSTKQVKSPRHSV
nr:hypothetical protein [Tanacetum cinerariifolium]